jgi:hypothetical protein
MPPPTLTLLPIEIDLFAKITVELMPTLLPILREAPFDTIILDTSFTNPPNIIPELQIKLSPILTHASLANER